MAGSLLHGNSNYTIKFKQAKKKVLRATIFFPLNGTAYKFRQTLSFVMKLNRHPCQLFSSFKNYNYASYRTSQHHQSRRVLGPCRRSNKTAA